MRLPKPDREWRYYFESALSMADEIKSGALADEQELADVNVEIHPKIIALLRLSDWSGAHRAARDMRETFLAEGYQPDGIRVTAGESWARRFEPRARG